MTLYTYKEALSRYGSRSAVSRQIDAGKLFNLQRNLYSTEAYADPLALAMKRHPQAIVTGLTAFYIYGHTDKVPEKIDLATRRNATRMSDPEVRQHFVANDLFEVGATTADHDGTRVRIYDQETMLYYLVHHDGKLPFDLFKEVMKSYRKRSGELDYHKLQSYADLRPGGRRNFERILREIL